eukprot:CAMPEP_0194673360 /NCGR_PEP_ID=MMETSP0295-20121207/7011_1 /TAXON_ID=39354 /ORGANISM="Heterosigma akashiwo, Strain CCMP2393" /LENGTH=32 /DNA_ID= /DNA_START= /DNA_END= /DNA_ORIENTATION=
MKRENCPLQMLGDRDRKDGGLIWAQHQDLQLY